uniref:Uncharacterized protein n=1 Tax=Arundo donax TaxID=35708 RepID=A0A0A9CI12_ARUDO
MLDDNVRSVASSSDTLIDALLLNRDRKPPTKASPAPLVSTSFSLGKRITGQVFTCKHNSAS